MTTFTMIILLPANVSPERASKDDHSIHVQTKSNTRQRRQRIPDVRHCLLDHLYPPFIHNSQFPAHNSQLTTHWLLTNGKKMKSFRLATVVNRHE